MRSRWDRLPPVAKYLLPRIGALAVAWLLATMAIFFLLFVATDPVDRYLPRSASQQTRAEFRHRIGLDKPAVRLYADWIRDFLGGDLGTTSPAQRSVSARVQHYAQPTIELLILSLALGAVAGVGLYVLHRRLRRSRDAIDVTQAILGSLPLIVLGPLVLIIPAQYWGYAPPLFGNFTPAYTHPWVNLRELTPPAVLVALPVGAAIMTDLQRNRESGQRALGTAAAVVFSALRAFPLAASGVIVAETIFLIPGFGTFLRQSLLNYDIFALRSLLGIVAFVSLICWLVPPRRTEPTGTASDVSPPRSWRWRDPVFVAAIALVAAYVLAGSLGPFLAHYNPNKFVGVRNAQPSMHHPFGTDRLGRDELSRVLYGARTSLKFVSAIIAFGFIPGAVAGLALKRLGRWPRRFVSELSGAYATLPWLVVLLAFLLAYGFGLRTFAFVLGLGGFLSAAALVSTVAAERRYSTRELFNAIGPSLIASAASLAALSILAEATMSFLGLSSERLGWGADIAEGRTFPFHYEHMALVGGALFTALLGFNLLRTSVVRFSNDEARSEWRRDFRAPTTNNVCAAGSSNSGVSRWPPRSSAASP